MIKTLRHLFCQSILFCFSFLSLQAQITINSKVDLTEYPSLNFEITNRDPNYLDQKRYDFFKVQDSDQVKIDSVSMSQVADTTNYSTENKCVLVLLESINHIDRREQVNTFFYALRAALPDFVNSGDSIQIAVFNLRQDNTRVLKKLHNGFTDDIEVLQTALDNYDPSSERESKAVSEIPGAINEGIALLVDVPVSFNKSILLLSEERTNLYSTQRTFVNVIKNAQEKEIVVNTIKYNRAGYLQHANPVLADQTYGEHHVLELSTGLLKTSNSTKQAQSEMLITSILNNVVRRSKGTVAAVSLTLENTYHDGKQLEILINQLNSSYNGEFSFTSPGNWYYGQIQKNTLASILISLLLLSVLIYIVLKLYKNHQSNKINALDDLRRQENEHSNQQTKIKNQQDEIDAIKRQEALRINKLKEIEYQKKTKAEEAILIMKMENLGGFPLVKFTDSTASETFEINRPKMTFGREKKSNNFHVANPNMSRTHFSIVFNYPDYTVIDNNSTNGMIINGYKLKESVLKNGDVIEIADATFTFYH